ncbi:hypothetical protein CHLRE_04g214050v5 [Chlamydomonas reinhardtii]|uniref:Molybdate transporter 1 n=2 Tax=Chlamydomonas reinhardtii TaxID=3055 RepID=MOT1_CHLRE|nr:uncharacterized protein CHLRE_04g214050v5 [Chlamydomonas reinhardtii]A6YCJ2.1 RecName: Full=Molybdate transporter 1 [Chlamydomonas reinhardtii]ABR24508.1 molybdate transporter [Chlamydomonas reinhardtii]PNW83960.1 hypothetical protein CHLRE_04g214050v5 [Chlamydomonas reinhardtii]
MALQNAWQNTKERARETWAQLTWSEVSGSLGDLGTFLPLLIGLVQKVHLDLGTTLTITGLYNIISGWQFRIPMCVQPMKTIAAVALAGGAAGLDLPQLLHAGLFVAGCVGLLGASQAIDLFNWLVPPPVIRGVQLAVGVKLAMKGVDMALRLHGGPSSGWRPWLGTEGLVVGAVALAAMIATTLPPRAARRGTLEAADEGGLGPRPTDTAFEPLLRRLPACCGGGDRAPQVEGAAVSAERAGLLAHAEGGERSGNLDDGTEAGVGAAAGGGGCGGGGGGGRIPSALIAVVVGLAMAVLHRPGLVWELRLGPTLPRLLRPSWPDFKTGALRGGLPQLPLTTLNSVIAVTQLANALFGDKPEAERRRWRPSAVALSVALLNGAGVWLGAMPCCHGAGGLAAQYKFGARTGHAPILLGCIKAALGLLFGGSLVVLLEAFPQPLLGALLTVSGIELASVVRHTRSPRGYTFALLTAVAILALDNTGTGFLVGLVGVAAVAAYEGAVAAAAARWPRVFARGGRA